MTWAAKAKLGDLVELLSGFPFDSSRFGNSGDIPIARIRDVVPGRSSTFFRGKFDSQFEIGDGDLLIGMDGEFNRARWQGGRAVLNQRVCRIRPANGKLHEPYLFHFLPRALKTIESSTSFVTVKHLSTKSIRAIDIPLPPLREQQRIAAILDNADALRAKRRAALAQLDALTQSIFLEMFGDPASNPKGWPVCAIGDLIESAAYGTSQKSELDGGMPVIRMNNITRSGEMNLADLKYMRLKESERERYLVRTGDVLFNRTNSADLVGKTAIYRETQPMAYAGYLIRLRVNRENDPEYLAGFLNTDYAKRMLRGMCKSIIGMANINATEIKAMRIAQPPVRAQREFARRMDAVEVAKATQRASLVEMDSLFSSLQHRAFRGRL